MRNDYGYASVGIDGMDSPGKGGALGHMGQQQKKVLVFNLEALVGFWFFLLVSFHSFNTLSVHDIAVVVRWMFRLISFRAESLSNNQTPYLLHTCSFHFFHRRRAGSERGFLFTQQVFKTDHRHQI